MAFWADFSGNPPGASALRAAGFSGVWRYIGLGGEGKQIHAAEYRDYVSNNMAVALVAELGVDDAWASLNDYKTGQARAEMARDDARHEGIPDSVIIACAADAHASSAAQITDAVAYASGFASVLGWSRTGFYGFRETSQAVHNANVCRVHWRAGSEPSAAEKQWVNFWQRNSPPQVAVVRGTTCDINEVYAPWEVTTVTAEEIRAIAIAVLDTDLGQGSLADAARKVNALLDALAWRTEALVNGRETVADGPSHGEPVKLVEMIKGAGVSVVDVERIVREAVQQHLRITGTVEITGA